MIDAALDAYRFLTMMLAVGDVSDLAANKRITPAEWKSDADPIARLAGTFHFREVKRCLIHIAIEIRCLDDDRDAAAKLKSDVGELLPDKAKPNSKEPLSLREACNKIIHATRIEVPTSDSGKADDGPVVILEGERSGVRWRATLDAVRFVREVSRNYSEL